MMFATLTRFPLHFALAALLLFAGCSTPPPSSSDELALKADCSSIRQTPQAPQTYYLRQNPLEMTPENIENGKQLYRREAKPVPCMNCHGVNGDGRGPIGKHLQPSPTDFTCKALMDNLPDGQLFWVIENGSGLFELEHEQSKAKIKRPGRRPRYTAMRGHKNELTEEQIWEVILYLRTFSK
ncbi:c-type cytochrome [Methylicorpusculum oleiharenae]|uniref:c-type cytochrome n=1 Tax=Methylicorpusculum oleiharenae TaxID=1338687 RepID=UPI001357314F|nr:cytochrome c [Methylicorpusculum oleiharenae]MCD2453692.1 c-type cytochrome [Methylicorpusculum oleiharenae]